MNLKQKNVYGTKNIVTISASLNTFDKMHTIILGVVVDASYQNLVMLEKSSAYCCRPMLLRIRNNVHHYNTNS